MYALETPKHDDAKVNDGPELNGGRATDDGVNGEAELNGGRDLRVIGQGDGASESGGVELNGEGISVGGGTNEDGGVELNRGRASGAGGPTINVVGDNKSDGANEGAGTDQNGCEADNSSCDDSSCDGCSNFGTTLDYGCSDVNGTQCVEHQGAGATRSPGANYRDTGATQQKQGQEQQHVYSAAGKQAKAHHENEHEEDDSVDQLFDDTQYREINSNLGSFEDEGTEGQPRWADRDMRYATFEVGMKFGNKAEFKATITNYSLVNRKDIFVYTNDRDRVRDKCKPPCKWLLYVSQVKALGTHDLVVKSINLQHTNNNHYWKNKKFTSKWDKAHKALKMVVKDIKGSADEQYGKIWRYVEEMKRSNMGITVEVMYTPFIEPGRNPRQLLKRRQGNTGTGSWHCCLKFIEIENSSQYTFAFDQQKGLASASTELLPNSNHRFDVQHMYRTSRKNTLILGARDNPIINMLEIIRKNLLAGIEQRTEWMKKYHGPMGPSIREIIEDTVKISRNGSSANLSHIGRE
ncbi:hypothetical protein ACH5RR_002825 [Cinchona calisaya]|uniref:Transposase MuDR plant domain-containing protein n=1 Tax=Cinchona calisaya TaxID=153742 RepID=A0ABD3ATN3_9GENT